MQFLANANYFQVPKVAQGKNPLYVKFWSKIYLILYPVCENFTTQTAIPLIYKHTCPASKRSNLHLKPKIF